MDTWWNFSQELKKKEEEEKALLFFRACDRAHSVRLEWEALGLRRTSSPKRGAATSGGFKPSSDAEPELRDGDEDSQFSADVSDGGRERAAQLQSWGVRLPHGYPGHQEGEATEGNGEIWHQP